MVEIVNTSAWSGQNAGPHVPLHVDPEKIKTPVKPLLHEQNGLPEALPGQGLRTHVDVKNGAGPTVHAHPNGVSLPPRQPMAPHIVVINGEPVWIKTRGRNSVGQVGGSTIVNMIYLSKNKRPKRS